MAYKVLLEVPSKLEMQCKKGVCFSLDFGWYSIHFDIVRQEQGSVFFCLTDKIRQREKSYLSTVPRQKIF